MSVKYLRYGLWAFVGIAFLTFLALSLPSQKNESALSIQPIAGFNKGTHFTLTDHKGQAFDSDTKIKDGEYALIFFGFTHCPVICPTELQKTAEIMDGLPPEISKKIKPIFITIDPERDTVDILNNYVPLFHEKITGLTGKTDDVHKILDAWKVFYTKVDDPQFTEYTMDHSTYIYMVDHEMTIRSLFRMKNTPDQIINAIQDIIQS